MIQVGCTWSPHGCVGQGQSHRELLGKEVLEVREPAGRVSPLGLSQCAPEKSCKETEFL